MTCLVRADCEANGTEVSGDMPRGETGAELVMGTDVAEGAWYGREEKRTGFGAFQMRQVEWRYDLAAAGCTVVHGVHMHHNALRLRRRNGEPLICVPASAPVG